ncbi:MAG: class I SAM-dependent methyltransferase [Candidatus Cloacimonetes bacterium]|jgi:ubiquinone/menaquinone biosynthesis C-methylase UbiE|nr:class I SAM-dependent methyltransferase [Candidatus Cloacimonadota bacterium]
MKINKAENQLLSLIRGIGRSGRKATKESILASGKHHYKDKFSNLSSAYKSLIQKKLIMELKEEYSLTNKAIIFMKKQRADGFGEMLIRKEKSTVYGKYCEMLHGKNISQFNMMNMEQLNKLLELLGINEHQRVLDLGCATGTIAEYISDKTQANIIGIDFAKTAIKWAQERTKPKQDRLKFITMDMDILDFPNKSFDTVIAIDTLYFVEDLNKTIQKMKAILKKNGKLGIFFSQMLKLEGDREILLPDKTKLAQALKKNNLKFRTWDFTDSEKEFWKKSKNIAETLKNEFETEGNSQIYESRISEANSILKFVDTDRISRHLYIANL